ncbi:MAG TPA: hypothetical protein VKZ67_07585 [Natronosporangium sp.]|nr:hypothetical protein [Natronosporangium sp.]
MPSAGDIITVPTVPGSRIATEIETNASDAFTTEATLMTLSDAPVVQGRIYRVRWVGGLDATDTAEVLLRLKADGTAFQLRRFPLVNVSGTTGVAAALEAEYTATATGAVTFTLTGQRLSGSGTCTMAATATSPCYLHLDYIRDA